LISASLLDVIDDIHALVRDTDNIYTLVTNGVKNQVHSFWKAVITCFNVITVFANEWILCKPGKSAKQQVQIFVCLLSSPLFNRYKARFPPDLLELIP
jgi:hypothetical protein